jgi:hypothetical protein
MNPNVLAKIEMLPGGPKMNMTMDTTAGAPK